MSDSLRPHGLYPWNSPGQNTGVGSLSLLQGIFPTQELNQGLLHCGRILYQLSYEGSLKSKGKDKSLCQGGFPTILYPIECCFWTIKVINGEYSEVQKNAKRKISSFGPHEAQLWSHDLLWPMSCQWRWLVLYQAETSRASAWFFMFSFCRLEGMYVSDIDKNSRWWKWPGWRVIRPHLLISPLPWHVSFVQESSHLRGDTSSDPAAGQCGWFHSCHFPSGKMTRSLNQSRRWDQALSGFPGHKGE